MAEDRYEDAIRHFTAAKEVIVRKRLDSGIARFTNERIDENVSICRVALLEKAGDGEPTMVPRESSASLERDRQTAAPARPQPFPWMSVATLVILGIVIVLAIVFR